MPITEATAAIIAAALGSAAAGATAAGQAGTATWGSEGDAHSLAIANLSSFSFKARPNTGRPVKGQWMDAPGDLPSLLDLFDEHRGLKEDDIAEIVQGLKVPGHGLKPWTIGVLAKAGGGWGPAALVCYDIYFRSQPTGSLLAVMVLTRPNWTYTAGAALGGTDFIDAKFDLSRQDWWGLYHEIEGGTDLPDTEVATDFGKKFSDGVRRVLKGSVAGHTLTVEFQPAKNALFKITDDRPLADEIASMMETSKP